QRNQLATHGKLLPFDVSTIESIGGGSVRCMLGEVFLPNRKAVL
ncbi:arginine deiminase-related protein, partial [Vibrio sp. 1751]